jgi:hypothetical protein
VVWKPDYITSAQLKNYLNIQHSEDDDFLALWATAVSRNVDDYCGRQFGQVATAQARVYDVHYSRHRLKYYALIDDLQDITGFTVADSNGNAITNYTLKPDNALLEGMVYEEIEFTSCPGNTITGTGLWGWSSVPSSVPTGCYLQGARLNIRRSSPYGVAGSPSTGSEIRLLAQLDPDFRTSLKPYVRDWWAQ